MRSVEPRGYVPIAAGLAVSVAPHGALRLVAAPTETPLDPEVAARLRAGFDRGDAFGLLELGAREVDAALPPSLAWWREVARLFVSGLCSIADGERNRGRVEVPLPRGELARLVSAAPPMDGAEYLTAALLEETWSALADAARLELRAFEGSVAEWLASKHASWAVVGRVWFHLVENKQDDGAAPFAFLATYSHRLTAGKGAKAEHVPLRRALEEYAGERNRARLLALLAPVERAAAKSTLVRELVDGGDLYHPLAWGVADAHRFLQEQPLFEESGLKVRVGDWWRGKASSPRLSVKIGHKAPQLLGAESLVAFDAGVTLDGERLRADDLRRILSATEGLVLVKGRWVEVDKRTLPAILAQLETLRAAEADGVPLREAMRLLAGARIGGDDDEAVGAAPAWQDVVAGPWLAELLGSMRRPEGITSVGSPRGLAGRLRPYQEVGLRWLWFLSKLGLGACLADDMGLGKTIQVLSLLLTLKARREAAGPHVLVAPATLLANWKAEAERFAPSLKTVWAHPSLDRDGEAAIAAKVEDADLVVTSYGMLRRAEFLSSRRWDLAILDEAQAIKNPGAAQTRAVKSLRAQRRIALTGTPVENRLGDLWSIFDFLNPGLLGSAKEFSRFSRALGADFRPLRELVRPYVLRRLKTDRAVAPDLPAKTEVVSWCGLTREQAAHYEQAVRALKAALADNSQEGRAMRRRGAILAALLRLKQICNHPAQWLGNGRWDASLSGKHARLAEIVETIAARQEKALVFTQFREIAEPLAAWLEKLFGRPGLTIHGAVDVKKRRAIVERFQADDGAPFLVATVKTGGTGLNLTAASHVIHFDRWWNPAVEDQATDRAFRIGQKRNVMVHKLVVRGTVEERIHELLESKRAIARGVLEGGAELALTEMADEALLELVKLDVKSALGEAA